MKAILLRSIGTGLLLAAFGATGALGQTLTTLSTTGGDGQVIVDVDGYGSFGYQTFAGGSRCGVGDALYDPLEIPPAQACTPDLGSTTWESAVYYRGATVSTFLTTGLVGSSIVSGGLADPGFASTPSAVSATSSFTFDGLEFDLEQTVQDVLDGLERVGSVLIQVYTVTNSGSVAVSFELVRYYEGDLFLGFGASVPDGGGHIIIGDEEFVFETDVAGEPELSTDLVGITACGGAEPEIGRFEVNMWPQFPDRIGGGQSLGDVVFGDDSPIDGFVDEGNDYDVGIALNNKFDLVAGESATYVTTTVFGTLAPVEASGGCREIVDIDDDGVPNDVDPHPQSDLSPTVLVNGCDSGVDNFVLPSGSSIADLVTDAVNSGDEDALEDLLEDLEDDGTLSEDEAEAIEDCAEDDDDDSDSDSD